MQKITLCKKLITADGISECERFSEVCVQHMAVRVTLKINSGNNCYAPMQHQ